MRIVPLAIFFLLLAGAGWWIAWSGPDAFPKVERQAPPENLNVDSAANANASATTNTAPTLSAPTGLRTTKQATDSVTIAWQVVPSVATYQLYRDNILIAQIEGQHFLDIGLAPGTTYLYGVASVGANGAMSVVSAPVSVVTVAATAPPSTTSTPAAQPSPTPTPAPKPAPTPAPILTQPTCGTGGACTPSQVAAHSTRSNCWVYLAPINKVYNITAYVANASRHPGGDVIASHCGANIYSYFIGSLGGHPHSSGALNRTLQAYYIGPLQS